MRISSFCGSPTLYEVFLSITAVEIMLGLKKVSLLQLLDQSEFINSADQFKDSLQQEKWLALTKLKSHRIKSDSGILMLKEINAKSYQTVSHVRITGAISVSAKRWPSFSGFVFTSGGSIVIKNEDYSTKVVSSPIGRIRRTAVERK